MPRTLPAEQRAVRGLVRDGWKLIVRGAEGTAELYDLGADPRERRDRADSLAADRDRLLEELGRLEAEIVEEGRARGWQAVPDGGDGISGEAREQLEALGYVE